MRENLSSGFMIWLDTNWTVQAEDSKGLGKKRDCTICVAKTKVLISCADTAQLICVFVFA